MRLLADRDVLRRRRNSGTFVGECMETSTATATLVQSIYVFLSSDRPPSERWRSDMYVGLSRVLKGVGLHVAVLPLGNEVRYVNELLSHAVAAKQLTGVVAVTCQREVYDYLVRQNAPAVVIGSVGPTEDKLASIDGDEHAAGRLLAEAMLRRGFRKFAVLVGELWHPGDNHFVEGFQRALEAAELSVGALRIRSLRHDVRVFQEELRNLISVSDEPLAVICQGVKFAQWLRDFRTSVPQLPWDRVGIAYHADTEQPDSSLPFPFTYQELSTVEMSAMVGEMFLKICSGSELPHRHILLPMGLRDPSLGVVGQKMNNDN